MKTRRFLTISCSLLAAGLALTGCGAKDTVEIQVATSIPVRMLKKPTGKTGTSNLMSVNVGYECYQDNTLLLVFDPALDQVIFSKKVKFKTRYNPTPVPALTWGNGSIDVSYIINRLNPGISNTSSFDEPLTITVPKNRAVEVAFLGTFFDPSDANVDGTCEANSGTYAKHSAQLFGHTPVTSEAISSGVLNLKIATLIANPTAPYTLNSTHKDWVELATGFYPAITKRISAGSDHTCSVTQDAAYCWGANSNGQLGTGTLGGYQAVPVSVTGLALGSGVTDISAGNQFTCAIVSGAAKCWGYNASGQLGNGTINNSAAPVSVSGATSGVQAISAGGASTCAIINGSAKCWGENSSGQLGNNDNTYTDSTTPAQVYGLSSNVTQISAGGSHACAAANNIMYCWGANGSGQLGDGTIISKISPVIVPLVSGIIQSISAGEFHTCAVVNSSVYCWGANGSGQVGDNSYTGRSYPTQVSGMNSGAVSVSAGSSHSCAIYNDLSIGKKNLLKCWGSNSNGELGIGNNTSPVAALTPMPLATPAPLDENKTMVELGTVYSCIVSQDGPHCWGYNANGQVGNASIISQFLATPAAGMTVSRMRLKQAHYAQFSATDPAFIHTPLDYDAVGLNNYYLPHVYPYTLDFYFTGANEKSGCLSGAPCSGYYKAVVNQDGFNGPPFITATLIQSSTGAPPPSVSTLPGSPFRMKNF